MNIHEFHPGDKIADRFTSTRYEVLVPDKNGMGEIRNLCTGSVEVWNAYNNNRFFKLEGQLSLFD